MNIAMTIHRIRPILPRRARIFSNKPVETIAEVHKAPPRSANKQKESFHTQRNVVLVVSTGATM